MKQPVWYNIGVKNRFLFLFGCLLWLFPIAELFADVPVNCVGELYRLVYHDKKPDIPFQIECTSIIDQHIEKPRTIAVHDTTNAVFLVTHNALSNLTIYAGDRIRAKGRTYIYDFNQIVALCESIEHTGRAAAPHPEYASAADIDSGRCDCRLVTIKGTLRDIFQDEIDKNFRYLVLNCDGRLIYATSTQIGINNVSVGSTIEITGICDPISIGGRRHMGRIIKIRDKNSIRIVNNPNENVFSSPLIDDVSLMGPMEIQSLGIRRARGIVIATWSPQRLLIKTEQGNLISATVANQKLPSNGDAVEIAGLPETDLFNINLSRAVWRTSDLRIEARQNVYDISFERLLPMSRKLNPYFHGNTIRIKGNVIGLESSGEHVGTILISESERILTIDTSMVTGAADGISVGSRIEVTGVCILETENWRPNSLFPPASGYRVVIRDPDDLRIISHPPWWTPKRLLAVIGILLAVLAALSVRMMITRRFNAMITKAKIDAKVGERTRLAVELHDSIAQDLTGIAMEIRSAKRAKDTDAAKIDRHLNLATAVLDSCRDELRNCIWDLRNLTLDDATIDEAIRRTLQQHLGGAKLEVRFAVERKRFSDNTFHTILRIIRELTINAVRHGAATDIKVAGCIDGGNLLISVRDNGCGFDPDNAPGASSGHFGLQGIRERVETLEGNFEIESGRKSGGTKAILTIPLKQNDKGNEE